MKTLNNEELVNTSGGGLKLWACLGGGAVVFVIGIIDGYLRPSKCK